MYIFFFLFKNKIYFTSFQSRARRKFRILCHNLFTSCRILINPKNHRKELVEKRDLDLERVL